jgi:hypothetical protein
MDFSLQLCCPLRAPVLWVTVLDCLTDASRALQRWLDGNIGMPYWLTTQEGPKWRATFSVIRWAIWRQHNWRGGRGMSHVSDTTNRHTGTRGTTHVQCDLEADLKEESSKQLLRSFAIQDHHAPKARLNLGDLLYSLFNLFIVQPPEALYAAIREHLGSSNPEEGITGINGLRFACHAQGSDTCANERFVKRSRTNTRAQGRSRS